MKICACFKPLPDFGQLNEPDWQEGLAGAGQGLPDFAHVRQVFNGYEESGLELGLRLADLAAAQGRGAELTALTLDHAGADPFLRRLLAVRYDHGVRIDPGSAGPDLDFNPLTVARIIARYAGTTAPQDLLIFGAQGGLGDNGQTGFLTAELLGWPCIREVTGVQVLDDGLRVTSLDRNREVCQEAALPLVLLVGNIQSHPFLRVPTLKEKLAAARKPVQVVDPGQLGLTSIAPQQARVRRIFLPQRKRSCALVEGRDSRERAETLYHGYLKERLAR